MNFTHFLEIFLQQCFLIVTCLIGLSMQTLKKQEWTEFLWRNNVYNDKISVEPRLEHGFAIDYSNVQ